MNEFLTWLVFAGGVCYGRQHGGKDKQFWDNLWALQRELKYPPIGLIRSC